MPLFKLGLSICSGDGLKWEGNWPVPSERTISGKVSSVPNGVGHKSLRSVSAILIGLL